MTEVFPGKYERFYAAKMPQFAQDVETKPVPVPIAGWNAIDPLSAMETKYAVKLTNWVPRTGYIEFRGGYNAWCQGLSSLPVQSLMTYRPESGIETLFGVTGSTIYNCSLYGLPSLSYSGLNSAKLQYVNFTPAGGNTYLYTVNGIDTPLLFNGTAWANASISGITPSNIANINVFKRRIWFIENNTTSAWYLDTDAIAGSVTEFPLGSLMPKGGYLVAMGTWLLDGGQGPDDYAVFATSKGQLIVFSGTDPDIATAFNYIGTFDLPSVIGRRCFVKIGSELGVITVQGLLPISQALPFDPSGVRSVAITNRIQNAMLQAGMLYNDHFGWEAIPFEQQALLLMNVPQAENSIQVQYVMNMQTGAWCDFGGWNANCFATFNQSLYFGDNSGNVNLAYAGSTDKSQAITADMKCAFNYFDDPGRIKQMTMVRPLLVADGTLIPTLSVDVDFADNSPSAPVTLLQPTGAIWDASLWDQSQWSSGAATVNNWLSVNALGTALAVRMKVNLGGVGTTNIGATSVFDTGVFDSMVFDGNGAIVASGTEIVTLRVNSFESLMEFGAAI